MFQCFCLCNDVMVSMDPKTGSATYDGSSQDELLLLQLAKESQFYELVSRDQYSMVLRDKKRGGNVTFTIVRNLAFTVERKRQSIVVKNQNNGDLVVFTKGADEVIYPLLEKESEMSHETRILQ